MRDVLFWRNSDCSGCVTFFERAVQGIAGDAGDLGEASALCYKRRMRDLREWISEKMRRRPRRGPNDSESTGKSGQELPSNQPAPLRPSYPEAVPSREAERQPDATPVHQAQPVAEAAPAAVSSHAPEQKQEHKAEPRAESPTERRMVMETQ